MNGRNSNQGGFCTALCFQWGVKDVPSRDILSEDIPSWEHSAQLDPLAEVSSSQSLTEYALCLGDN